MPTTDLQEVAKAVVRRAQRQGSVLPREIRDELAHVSLPRTQWKEVVALSRPVLRCRQGRYYYRPVVSARLREEMRRQRAIRQAVRRLVREHKQTSSPTERRKQGRASFIQPVKVRIEGHRELTVLSRDLSPTGIRLIGTQGLLGQKALVLIPCPGGEPLCFLMRVLWTCTVGDGLFENGGCFLELVEGEADSRQ